MKPNEKFLVGFIIFFISCNYQQENTIPASLTPKVMEAKGDTVYLDNMAKPTISVARNSVIVKATPTKVVTSKTNVHMAGNPKIVEAGRPKIVTPGQGSYSLPKTVPAIDSVFTAAIPEEIIAKEAYSKEQNPQNFSSFGKLQGLKHSVVSCLLQDRNGNLWFGFAPGGAGRYDGKVFAHFTAKEGLSNNGVFCLLEDKNGNIWFGTEGDGAFRYDGKKITHFTEKQGFVNNRVNTMFEDRDGNLWFGTRGGVSRYDGKTFTHFTEKEGLGHNYVLSIIEDKDGNLWFGSFGGGVCQYDRKQFYNFTAKEGLSDNSVYSIAEDGSGNLWFGTTRGVNRYDGENFFHFTKKEGLGDDNIFSILKDKNGHLWFGTHGGGISIYDGRSFTNLTEKEGLSNNFVWKILEDQSKNIWIATMGGGINKFNGKQFTHFTEKDGLTSKNVQSFLQDTSGNLWFGTNAGLTKYDGKFFTQYIDKRGIDYNGIWSLVQDKMGNLWVGTFSGGISKYDGKNITHFTTNEGLADNYVWCIMEDRKGNLWFGTGSGGIDKYNGKTFEHFTEKQGLNSNFIFSLLEDKKGNIWIGTDSGVYKYDEKCFIRFKMTGGLSSDVVLSIMEDKNDNLWFGTSGGGVNKYNGKTFTHFTEKEGLSNNTVYSMLADIKGNLMFGTSLGFDKLENDKLSAVSKVQKVDGIDSLAIADNIKTQAGFFKNYTNEDGFSGIGVNDSKTIFEDKDGTVWIGANGMLTAFHQDNETIDTLAPNLQLTAIDVFGEKIPWQHLENKQDTVLVLGNNTRLASFDFSGVSKWYGVPENLNLAYNNNSLTFQFVGITLTTPKKVKYQVKRGQDENWSALTSRSEAIYGDLASGKYVFKVRAMNGEGYWSSELHYPFIIRPPWWHTGWAYLLYSLLFIAAVWTIYRYQKKRIIRIEQQKAQKKELEHAKEIERAYTELQATQSQLIQREKMASLGELTSGIAHEIQNPLNFVNNFSEVNRELLIEMKDEIGKGNLREVESLANDIIDNEEKINHHGKRADVIVKGMLQHSRSSSAIKEPTDVNALADQYLRISYHGLRAKDNSFSSILKTDFDGSIGNINVTQQDIGRVLLNLCNNAFYAVNEKKKQLDAGYEPIVSLSTKKIVDKVEITVSDNGTGILQNVRDKIFQPFFTTKPTGQGTGLGLSLSYDIIKAHGGEIKVESTEGEYSKFVILLPV